MTARIFPPTRREGASGYLLEIEHPRTGAITFESYISLAGVIARAAKLIQGGYSIGIWSAASLEHRPGDPMAANDDVWIDSLRETLAGERSSGGPANLFARSNP
jgi:hypothetical protein